MCEFTHIERGQCGAVGVKGVVVEIRELLSDYSEVCHAERVNARKCTVWSRNTGGWKEEEK